MTEERIKLQADGDLVAAWRTGLSMGRRLGFGSFKQACLSGAILELSRNVVEKGDSAVCVISDASDPGMLRARVVIEGCGPDAAARACQRLNSELNIGPGLPAMRLNQVVESCEVQSDATQIVFTVNEARLARRSRF